MRKAAELREKTVEELQAEARDLSEQLFKLRFQKATGQLENLARMKELRRDLARVRTVLTEKRKAGA